MWKSFFKSNEKPLVLTSFEVKAIASFLMKAKPLSTQREIVVQLLLNLADESYIRVVAAVGAKNMEKILISC